VKRLKLLLTATATIPFVLLAGPAQPSLASCLGPDGPLAVLAVRGCGTPVKPCTLPDYTVKGGIYDFTFTTHDGEKVIHHLYVGKTSNLRKRKAYWKRWALEHHVAIHFEVITRASESARRTGAEYLVWRWIKDFIAINQDYAIKNLISPLSRANPDFATIVRAGKTALKRTEAPGADDLSESGGALPAPFYKDIGDC